MIYAGLDISVNSTALCIYNNKYNFFNYTNKNSKWLKKTSTIINYRFINFKYKTLKNFSETLIQKIKDYDILSDLIIKDLLLFDDKITLWIEGYNYGLTRTDSIIDICELSSIIKMKIINNIEDININIIPPKSLKTKTCKLVYNNQKNNNDVSGGNFDKIDMFHSLLDSNITNDLKIFLNQNIDVLSKMKKIPKPFDDLIDANFLVELGK